MEIHALRSQSALEVKNGMFTPIVVSAPTISMSGEDDALIFRYVLVDES